MTTTIDRSELLFLGKECHHNACHLHDFLPFSCPACKETFCQPHFLPSQHSCTAPLPPSMIDRIAPTCPLCNSVVPTTNGGPNEAVERHILAGVCTGFEGGEQRKKEELRRKKERGEVCFRKGCLKVLVVPMKCESCKHLFCPTHRHSTTHTCSPTATPSGSTSVSRSNTPQPASAPAATKSAMSRLMPTKSSSNQSSSTPTFRPPPAPASPVVPVSAKIDARAAAATAAMKRAGQDVKDVKVPFVKSKTDKRATAEQHSQIQALRVRHEKGLLTKAEELKYAELVGSNESARRKGEKSSSAGTGKGKGKDKDCVIC